jgi:hypothetical protein
LSYWWIWEGYLELEEVYHLGRVWLADVDDRGRDVNRRAINDRVDETLVS